MLGVQVSADSHITDQVMLLANSDLVSLQRSFLFEDMVKVDLYLCIIFCC